MGKHVCYNIFEKMKESEELMNKNINSTILNNVFSQKMLTELINTGNSEILNRAFASIVENADLRISNYIKIKSLYNELNKHYRNEYFYKNTLINKILIGRHSVNTTSALSELPINKSIADLIMINGKAIVYEIKTKLDSLQRIDNQIRDYYKAFKHVAIVADELHKEKIISKYGHSPVGIYTITNRSTIRTYKKPDSYSENLDTLVIYKILRKDERYQLVSKHFHEIPDFNQFEEFEELYKLFSLINIDDLYSYFIQILKERSNVKENKNFFDTVPREIKSLVYFNNPVPSEYKQIFDTID